VPHGGRGSACRMGEGVQRAAWGKGFSVPHEIRSCSLYRYNDIGTDLTLLNAYALQAWAFLIGEYISAVSSQGVASAILH
jgi:hypothetical protein